MLEKCPPEFKPVIYKSYVGDIFCISKHESNWKIQNYLNLQHTNIKFISEIEMDNSLSFLDIKINRENNKLTTSGYRMFTSSDVYTNFESSTTNSHKDVLTFSLLHRAFKLCFNFELYISPRNWKFKKRF